MIRDRQPNAAREAESQLQREGIAGKELQQPAKNGRSGSDVSTNAWECSRPPGYAASADRR